MGRWEPNAADRLSRAALDVYVEKGFEQATVAEIASRAGLTARTFFRYFADKREVLFAGGETLQTRMVEGLEAAPEDASPLAAVAAALEASADVLGAHREFSRQRHAVISANPELRERELVKLATLADALAEALRRRGVADPEASLAAETGIAVLRVAFERWVSEPGEPELADLMRDSLARLSSLAVR
jgi:AcrR family transcriptional regulator